MMIIGNHEAYVNLQNILVTEPQPRNPLLADIAKRIGLAERTGRGIDRIFMGMLRYGRPAPDFSRSDSTSVILQLSSSEGDMDFLQIVLREEERIGSPMPLDSLIALSRLRSERRLTITDLAPFLQKPEQEARRTIKKLVEVGLVEAHGKLASRGMARPLFTRDLPKIRAPRIKCVYSERPNRQRHHLRRPFFEPRQ